MLFATFGSCLGLALVAHAQVITDCLNQCDASDTTCQASCLEVALPDDNSVDRVQSCTVDCIENNTTSDEYTECINRCIQDGYYTSRVGVVPTSSAEETVSSSSSTEERATETTSSGSTDDDDDDDKDRKTMRTNETTATTSSAETSTFANTEPTSHDLTNEEPSNDNSDSNTSDGDGGSSGTNSLAIGLGVGLGVGIPLLLAVIAFVWFRKWRNDKRQRTGMGASPPMESPNDGQSPQGVFSKAELPAVGVTGAAGGEYAPTAWMGNVSGAGEPFGELSHHGRGTPVVEMGNAERPLAELGQHGRGTPMAEVGDGSVVSKYELPATRR